MHSTLLIFNLPSQLGEFAPQPRKSATAVVPSTSRSSAFKRPVNRPTAPKQTPAAITNSTFFRPTGPDTAWIEALLNDVDLSKPSRSDLEIDQLCNARIVKRVRKWQERLGSRNIDPRLLKHVEELDPASQTVESMESKTGAKGAARQETSEKEPKPLSGSRPRNAIAEAASSSTTHQRSTPISVVPGRAETLAASSVPRKGTPRQRPEQTFVLTPPRDQPVRSSASPSQRLSQSSSRDRVPPIPHSPFKPPRRSAEVSASAASESKQKGKAVDRGTPQEVNIEVAQRDGEQARIKWDGSPSQETLEQARAIEELRKKHRKEEEDARQRIGEAQRDTRPCQSAVHADSDSDSEDEVNRQLLSQDQYSQSQSKKFASSSPAIPRDRPQWSHRSDMSTNRADAPTSALRLLDRSFASSSRRQTLPRPSASAGSSSKRHTAPRLSLPASARPTPSATAPTQAFPPSTLPLPTAAQHPVLETTASMIKNALEFEFGGDSTCESFSLTFQEQGFPRGGQGQRQAKLTATNADDEDPFEQEATEPPQGERPARIEAVPASASSSSSRRKRERAGDTSQEGKENPSAHKRPSKKLESTDGGHVGRRKGPEVEEKAAQSRGKTSETDIPRTDIDLTLPTSSIEVVTIPESPARSKKRAASATQIPHSPTSLSPEQSRPSKRPRRDSRPLVAPVATAIPTQIATSQVGATLCDEWDSIVASFAAARTQKEAKGESAIEKMKRLRERRKRHEALYGNQPLRA